MQIRTWKTGNTLTDGLIK